MNRKEESRRVRSTTAQSVYRKDHIYRKGNTTWTSLGEENTLLIGETHAALRVCRRTKQFSDKRNI